MAANAAETKTVMYGEETRWVADSDRIGIFSPQAKPTSDGSAPTNNAAFTALNSAKNSNFSGSLYWGSDSNHNFYAYYPYNSGYAGDQTAVPISLPSEQNQSAAGNSDHIGALDYMVATPRTVASGSTVNLTFNHVFSMIELQLVGSGQLTCLRPRQQIHMQ